MKAIIAKLVKSVFTESVLKQIFIVIGDHFVASSKNKLDDKISCLEKELRKYHPIPNSIDEAIRYAAQGLRL